MIFLEVCEWLVCIVFLATMVTQVIVPILCNRPIFPIFKRTHRRLDHEIAKAHEEYDLAEKKKELDHLREELEQAADEYSRHLNKG